MADTQPAELFIKGLPGTGTNAQSEEMRNQLQALKQMFYTNDESKPETAQLDPGQPRVNVFDPNNIKLEFYLNGGWRTVLQFMQLGLKLPALRSQAFDTQTQWIYDHNLGLKPLVQVVNAAGQLLEVVQSQPEQIINLGQFSDPYLAARPSNTTDRRSADIPLPYNGIVVNAFVSLSADLVYSLGDFAFVHFLIDAVAVTGADIILPKDTDRPNIILGGNATANNAFTPSNVLNVDITMPVAASIAEGEFDLFIVLRRTLNTNQCTVQHVSDNRIIVTHPANLSGSIIIVG